MSREKIIRRISIIVLQVCLAVTGTLFTATVLLGAILKPNKFVIRVGAQECCAPTYYGQGNMTKIIEKISIITLLVCLISGLIGAGALAKTPAAASQAYTWKNVEIVGGGFVTGVIFNARQKDLVYARTDIGGAYRWNPTTRRWIPLTDWVGDSENWLLGIESLATDPVDPNRVYIATGAYIQSWGGNGTIFRSTDQGATWLRTDMPFQMGGNEPGRGIGERLMVDPNKNSILYFGTRNNGLYKSTDYGATWARVTSFPVTGQANLGLGWVAFDPASSTSGNATKTIYVGVVDSATPVYRSTDAGVTWTALAGQPSAGMPHHGAVSSDGTLYLTYSDQAGPNTFSSGAVWKYAPATSTWTDITPAKPNTGTESGFGYGGLALDASKPGTVMVATLNRWWPGDDIFRSTDGGATWKSMTANKVLDVSGAPYLNWGGTATMGWWMATLQIDPFNSGHILYGTGGGIMGADDVTNLDSGGVAHINVRAQGLEETSVQDLISPPSGAPLISAIGDVSGFRHDDLTISPPAGMSSNPIYATETGLDFAELNPAIIVRVGRPGSDSSATRCSYSTDGGATWSPVAAEPAGLSDGAGTVAIAADGSATVWTPANAIPYLTKDRGATWQAVSSLPSGVRVVSDRVNPKKFYASGSAGVYASTDGGATFSLKAASPTGFMRAVPGREGDVWLASKTGGLYHSTNSGVSFAVSSTFTSAEVVGFGKAATGQAYMAIYVVGTLGGVHGVYRSDDAGATWVQINDSQHQWGWIGMTITGDPRVYGRIYIATNGRGIIYGDPAGTAAPTSTPIRTVGASPTQTVGASPTRTLTPLAATNTPTRTSTVVASPTRTATAGTPLTATRTPTVGISLTATRTNTPGASSTRTPTPIVPTATPTSSGGSVCSPVASTITAPFTFDGAGTFCWQSSNLGAYINSWNATSITINGVNATNVYLASASYPAKIGGYWYVSYNSTVSWAHFESK